MRPYATASLLAAASLVAGEIPDVDAEVHTLGEHREATNDDEWGPHGGLMQEIAQYTYQYEHFPEVLGMLWRRCRLLLHVLMLSL